MAQSNKKCKQAYRWQIPLLADILLQQLCMQAPTTKLFDSPMQEQKTFQMQKEKLHNLYWH